MLCEQFMNECSALLLDVRSVLAVSQGQASTVVAGYVAVQKELAQELCKRKTARLHYILCLWHT